jgi:hypothetical protein
MEWDLAAIILAQLNKRQKPQCYYYTSFKLSCQAEFVNFAVKSEKLK